MILLWSDTHFNHEGIIRYCGRPYASADEMNAALIERWNSVVKDTDDIYLLGDFGFRARQRLIDGDLIDGPTLAVIFKALRGRKHLVIGNHDERNPEVFKLPWESQRDIVTLKENGVRAIACHYPMETWKQAHRGYLMVHGHSHGSLERKLPHRFDVGVDVRQAPVTLAALAMEASEQTFAPTDHHGKDL